MGALPATCHSPQPMDRVSNTCLGNSQHACDLKKLEEHPLGLCVFSSVHPVVQEPRRAAFACDSEGCGKLMEVLSSGASWLWWQRVSPMQGVSPIWSWDGMRGGSMSQTDIFPLGCLFSLLTEH